MHPFGGTQYCPRCSKPVYAAEQVMGPGRKLYHKPCLACMTCNKRLDSYTLLEHDQMPYCKSCHIKNFGNRDLRQANLPHYDVTPSTTPPSSSPMSAWGAGDSSDGIVAPRSKPWAASTPFPRTVLEVLPSNEAAQDEHDAEESQDTVDESSLSPYPISRSPPLDTRSGVPTNTGRPGIPRTVSLSPTRVSGSGNQSRHRPGGSVSSINPLSRSAATALPTEIQSSMNQMGREAMRPVVQMSTGTRYGAALGGGVGAQITGGGSPNKWGMGTPSCPRCGKSVYFAEQVKAVGKTYHKGCLRCNECSTLLDSSRLRDHDGDPLCVRCYGKLHGPQGAGYALLGKAGG